MCIMYDGAAGVAQRWCNGLPRDGLGFDARWEMCKKRASRPSQGTVKGGAVLMISLSMGRKTQPTNQYI